MDQWDDTVSLAVRTFAFTLSILVESTFFLNDNHPKLVPDTTRPGGFPS